MPHEIWINLPVKDVLVSKKFFTDIGFRFNEEKCNGQQSACMIVGDKQQVVMLFQEQILRDFAQNPLTGPNGPTELLISFDAATPEEVNETARKVAAAGGMVFAPPAESQGWLYGFAFADPDGHRWNQLYMDRSKRPG